MALSAVSGTAGGTMDCLTDTSANPGNSKEASCNTLMTVADAARAVAPCCRTVRNRAARSLENDGYEPQGFFRETRAMGSLLLPFTLRYELLTFVVAALVVCVALAWHYLRM
jgi:hypothetical protein